MHYNRLILTALFSLQLLACATPSQHFNQLALDYGFYPATEQAGFQHRLYLNKAAYQGTEKKVLHVYLDGDGTPWRKQRWIAKDPTARNPLILDLMVQDSNPAILLGRPCYYGLNLTPACHPKFWTSHRYSRAVRDSLVAALQNWLAKHRYQKLVLIGYSGGGTLATLMAPYIKQTDKLVTIAANLDVTAWSYFHGYPDLNDSLNPIDMPILKQTIEQSHWVGKEDEIVPPFVVKAYADQQMSVDFRVIEGFNHLCCWQDKWGEVLESIQ